MVVYKEHQNRELVNDVRGLGQLGNMFLTPADSHGQWDLIRDTTKEKVQIRTATAAAVKTP